MGANTSPNAKQAAIKGAMSFLAIEEVLRRRRCEKLLTVGYITVLSPRWLKRAP